MGSLFFLFQTFLPSSFLLSPRSAFFLRWIALSFSTCCLVPNSFSFLPAIRFPFPVEVSSGAVVFVPMLRFGSMRESS